jgi:hypothetical protein
MIDKVMQKNSVIGTIENGFVHIPNNASGLTKYLHGLATFPRGKFDGHANSTSQALDEFRQSFRNHLHGLFEHYKKGARKLCRKAEAILGSPDSPRSKTREG